MESAPDNIQQKPERTVSSFRTELRAWARDVFIALGLVMVIIVFLYQP